MQFGKKFDRHSVEERSTTTSGYAENAIWNFQAGETMVTFLEDLDNWTEYWEHYDANANKFFPCPGRDNGCPGCEAKLRSAQKWLVTAYVIETDSDKISAGEVYLFKIPKSLMNKVVRNADKAGTLLEHDYVIIRMGEGLDTEYDLDRSDRTDTNVAKYSDKIVDHQEAMAASYQEYTGKAEGNTEAEEKPVSRLAERRAARESKTTHPVKMMEDPGPPSKPRAPRIVRDEPEEISVSAIMKMEFDQIAKLAERAGLDMPEDVSEASELANWLIDELESSS